MMKSANKDNIGSEPFFVDMMNPDGEFSNNNIEIYYYRDP